VRTVATQGRGVDALLAETARLLMTTRAAETEKREKRVLAWMLRESLLAALKGD
jgi:hypothetical protein